MPFVTGTLTVDDSTFEQNTAKYGGGLWAETAGSAAVAISNSTFYANSADNGASPGTGSGGGAYFWGGNDSGLVTVHNSTFSGNNAVQHNGGIRSQNGGVVVIVNTTITNNTAGLESGGTSAYGGSVATLHNTIVAGNFSLGTPQYADATGAFDAASSHNLVGLTNSLELQNEAKGNIWGINDPLLAPLGNNGGPTRTHALLPGSLAIDAGDFDETSAAVLMLDQRGVNRHFFDPAATDGVDIGAVEQGLVVTTANDEDDATFDRNNLSLREALAVAAANFAVTGEVNRITFDASIGDALNLSLGELLVDSDVQIAGPGKDLLTIDAGGVANSTRVFNISSTATAEIAGVTITGGYATGGGASDDGGAIYNSGDLTLREVHITGNEAIDQGGGIFTSGPLHLENSTVDWNDAARSVGIHASLGSTETFTILASTIANNTGTGNGGGLLLKGTTDAQIINSTFSGNSGGYGGGVRVLGATDVDFINTTITENTATGHAGGLQSAGTGTVTLHNTIVAGNTAPSAANVSGTLASNSSYNLFTQTSVTGVSGPGNVYGQDVNDVFLLNTVAEPQDPDYDTPWLTDFGGPTETYALVPDSPAVNAGNEDAAINALGKRLLWDQRGVGYHRINGINGDELDIGASEANVIQVPGYDRLFVYGTDLDDTISYITQSTLLNGLVSLNATHTFFVPRLPDSIEVFAAGGDDNVSISTSIFTPSFTITIYGEAGADVLKGGSRAEQLWGGEGDDELTGGSGDDDLRGEAGNDRIIGSFGNDMLYGGAGQDYLEGGDGDDDLFGEDDNDTLVGGLGDDTLDGQNGVDLILPGIEPSDDPDQVNLNIPSNPLTADDETSYVLTLDWTGVDAANVDINWGDGNPTLMVLNGAQPPAHPYSPTASETGNFEIIAKYTQDGDEVRSESHFVAVSSDNVPLVPINVTADRSDDDTTVSWQTLTTDPNVSFDVMSSPTGLGDPGTPSTPNGDWRSDGSFSVSNATFNDEIRKRYYSVRTEVEGVFSSWSEPVVAHNALDAKILSLDVTVDTTASGVTLTWPDEYGLQQDTADVDYRFQRRAVGEPNYVVLETLSADKLEGRFWTDSSIDSANQIFEYRVDVFRPTGALTLPSTTGLVSATLRRVDYLQENRGTVILIVDDRHTDPLNYELSRFEQDLVGDGWHVERHDVDVRGANAETIYDIRAQIVADYDRTDIPQAKSVILIGDIPVPRSGWASPDGHVAGTAPADVFYGDMDEIVAEDDGLWTDDQDLSVGAGEASDRNTIGDGQFDQNSVPDDGDGKPVELSVGRIDMSSMASYDPMSTYTAGGDWQSYKIEVGKIFDVGEEFNSVSFVNGVHWNPVIDRTGEAEFRNVVIRNVIKSGDSMPSDITVELNSSQTFEKARDQFGRGRAGIDARAMVSFSMEGTDEILKLERVINPVGDPDDTGRVFRVADIGTSFTITPESVLEVDFRSNDLGLGSVVAIGLDLTDEEDQFGRELISEEFTFRLHADHEHVPTNQKMWGREIDPILETELLRRYLNKDHAYRHGFFTVEPRALVDVDSAAPVGTEVQAWERAAALFGDDVVYEDWRTTLDDVQNSVLWAYGGGQGRHWGSSGTLDSRFLSETPSYAVFTKHEASYAHDWDRTDNYLRSVLANDGYGLVSLYSRKDNGLDYQNMRVGNTVGESFLESHNEAENGLQDQGNGELGVFYNILGDPTLRMHIVAPPTNLVTTDNGVDTSLTWNLSADDMGSGSTPDFLGYHIYRRNQVTDDFERIDTVDPGVSTYDDSDVTGEEYMVRAINLQRGAGSYVNLSQGAFDELPRVVGVTVSGPNVLDGNHLPRDGSYDVPVGSGEQIRTVPVGGANTISVTFSEDVDVQRGDLTLYGAHTEYTYNAERDSLPLADGFSYSSDIFTATWTFDNDGVLSTPYMFEEFLPGPGNETLLADQMELTLSGVTEALGTRELDGNWTNPTSLSATGTTLFPSGNGVEEMGEVFTFYFTILPADLSRDNIASFADLSFLAPMGSTPGQFMIGDANGDGIVDEDDQDDIILPLVSAFPPLDFTSWPAAPLSALYGTGGGNSSTAATDEAFFLLGTSEQEDEEGDEFVRGLAEALVV